MKIDMYKYLNTGKLIEHAVLTMLGQNIDDIIPDGGKKKVKPIDMVFTMNGIEVNIEEWFEDLENQWNSQVKQEAKEMMNNLIPNKIYALNEVLQNIEWKIEEEIKKVFPEEE